VADGSCCGNCRKSGFRDDGRHAAGLRRRTGRSCSAGQPERFA
jgi:hypothetical protein